MLATPLYKNIYSTFLVFVVATFFVAAFVVLLRGAGAVLAGSDFWALEAEVFAS
jgi:hypothetical protein